MEHDRTTFFCHESSKPRVVIHHEPGAGGGWPYTLSIHDAARPYASPLVVIHISSQRQLNELLETVYSEVQRIVEEEAEKQT